MATNLDEFLTGTEHASVDHTGLAGAIKAQKDAGTLTGAQPALNFTDNGGIVVSVTEDGGNNKIDIDISVAALVVDISRGSTGGSAGSTAVLSGGRDDLVGAFGWMAGVIKANNNADGNTTLSVGFYENKSPQDHGNIYVDLTAPGTTKGSEGGAGTYCLRAGDGTGFTITDGGSNPQIGRAAGTSDAHMMGMLVHLTGQVTF